MQLFLKSTSGAGLLQSSTAINANNGAMSQDAWLSSTNDFDDDDEDSGDAFIGEGESILA